MINEEQIKKEIVWEESRFGLGDRLLKGTYKGRTCQIPDRLVRSKHEAQQLIEQQIFDYTRLEDIRQRLYNARREMAMRFGQSAKWAILSRDVWNFYSNEIQKKVPMYMGPIGIPMIEGGLNVAIVDGPATDIVEVA